MNKALDCAKKLIDYLPNVPGYTEDIGEITITIGQSGGNARWANVMFSTIDQLELNGGILASKRSIRINLPLKQF